MQRIFYFFVLTVFFWFQELRLQLTPEREQKSCRGPELGWGEQGVLILLEETQQPRELETTCLLHNLNKMFSESPSPALFNWFSFCHILL